MYGPLIAMAGIAALIAAVVGWAIARRYGRRLALVVPVLAVVAAMISVARAGGSDPDDMTVRVALAFAFVGPSVAGALAGLLLAGRGKR
jgi:uncharacterized membrane protein YfcA